MKKSDKELYEAALSDAIENYLPFEDGYLSSLKEAAQVHGIPYGDEMERFVQCATKKLEALDDGERA